MDMRKNRFTIFFFFFCTLFNFSKNLNAASTSPSQTVPKVLEDIEKEKIKKRDSQELLKGLENTKIKREQLDQISVIVSSIVVIASKELQNIINFDIYKNQLVSKSSTINELNMIANSMTKDYQSKDFPLVRVILPKQELKKEGATVFFKVINGFIEKINLEKVPKIQRKLMEIKKICDLNKKQLYIFFAPQKFDIENNFYKNNDYNNFLKSLKISKEINNPKQFSKEIVFKKKISMNKHHSNPIITKE